jgi:hypothetical protein
MTEIYFITRHTPFWAIPIFVMSGEFGYLFWLKKKKKSSYVLHDPGVSFSGRHELLLLGRRSGEIGQHPQKDISYLSLK